MRRLHFLAFLAVGLLAAVTEWRPAIWVLELMAARERDKAVRP